MPYATRDDLTERFGEAEIAQRERMLPPGAIERALSDAGQDVDGYLSARYTVPVSPIPATLVRLACDIARYRLLGDAASDDVRSRYKDAISALRDIGAGRSRLTDAAPIAAASESATVEIVSAPRVFGRPHP